MTTLPISARTPYRFDPLVEAVTEAREALADADRKMTEAEAMPEGKDRALAVLEAEVDHDEAKEMLKTAETALAQHGDICPTYLLRVPTPRTRQALTALMAALPTYPNDTSMLKALSAAAKDGVYSGEDVLALETLVEAARGRGNLREQQLATELTRLAEIAGEHPAVTAIRMKRADAQAKYTEMNVRFHLMGWEGGGLGAFPPRGKGDLADESVIDTIPLDHYDAIAVKVSELSGLRGRQLGNSSGPQ